MRQQLEVRSPRLGEATVPVTLRTQVRVVAQVAHAGVREARNDRGSVIGRAVVDDDQLEVREGLGQH